MKRKIKSILLSYDTAVAFAITIVIMFFLPTTIRADFAMSFYSVGISVLSIVFSLFFTALAIIMSSSDNDFINYLEEKGRYSFLMFTFKVTLTSLFLSLCYSIFIYVYMDFFIKHKSPDYKISSLFFLVFVLLFTYSLAASLLSVKDTISFSKYRLLYLNVLKKEKEEAEKTKKS